MAVVVIFRGNIVIEEFEYCIIRGIVSGKGYRFAAMMKSLKEEFISQSNIKLVQRR